MITTNGQLYQWDTGRFIEVYPVSNYKVVEIHVYNGTTQGALVLKTWVEGGKTYAKIPDLLLQSDANLDIFVIMADSTDNRTTEHKNVTVKWRAKPQDYVYTEEEVINYDSILKRLEHLENTGGVLNGIPSGGKAGQLLYKKSDEDFDVEWRDLEIPEQYGLVTYNQDKVIKIT